MTDAPILSIANIAKSFGKKSVLKNVSLDIYPGQHVGLVGNNGQGKTTLMKIVLGLLASDGGSIQIAGIDISHQRSAESKRRMGYLPETVAFYPNLSGRETLRYFARLMGVERNKVESVLEQVGLVYAGNERVRSYSKGMRQRLGLAQALLGNPQLLLLDEPTNGLDPSGISEFYQILYRLQQDKVAVLMSSHLLAEVEPRLDRLALLQQGSITRFGPLQQLINESGLLSQIGFRLASEKSAASLLPELERLGISWHHDTVNKRYWLPCSSAAKIDTLKTLINKAAGNKVGSPHILQDLVVEDPGLEQLFLSYNDQNGKATV